MWYCEAASQIVVFQNKENDSFFLKSLYMNIKEYWQEMNKTSTFYFSAHKDKWISYVNIRLHLKILQVRTTVCKLKEDEQLILIKQICKIE